MWVEILTPAQAAKTPKTPIAPPQPMPFELRIVVWSTSECAPKDVCMCMCV